MQESFWWWQCSDRYIISLFPHLHTPFPHFSPSLISLVVSVDVKHHVYLLNTDEILGVEFSPWSTGPFSTLRVHLCVCVCWSWLVFLGTVLTGLAGTTAGQESSSLQHQREPASRSVGGQSYSIVTVRCLWLYGVREVFVIAGKVYMRCLHLSSVCKAFVRCLWSEMSVRCLWSEVVVEWDVCKVLVKWDICEVLVRSDVCKVYVEMFHKVYVEIFHFERWGEMFVRCF